MSEKDYQKYFKPVPIQETWNSDLYQKLQSIGWEIIPPDPGSPDSETLFLTSYWPDYNYFYLICGVDSGRISIDYPGRFGTGHRSNTGPYCHDLGNEFIKLGCTPLFGEWGEGQPKPLHLYNSTDIFHTIVGFIIIFLFVAFLIFIFS